MEKQIRKKRPRIKQVTKTRSILQQEINSICPLCDNTEVGYFEIHHIDENRENSELSNLLLVCPTCHSKITKGDISRETVEKTKKGLLFKQQIEIASITIDSDNCTWEKSDNVEHAFYRNGSDKSPFPIISFSLINHSNRTILLKEIELKTKHLYSGLSGIPEPKILKSLAEFKIQLPYGDETEFYKLHDEIEVPARQAFKFKVQIYSSYYPIRERKVLYFNFKFNNNISISAPSVFLNCESENEGLKVVILD
jgi:hypothetical protein